MKMTSDRIFFSMYGGERAKINSATASIDWVIKYGSLGWSIALSTDLTFILAGASYGNSHLGKLSYSTGSLLSSYRA